MRFSSQARMRLAFLPYVVVGVLHVAALAAVSLGADVAALVTASKPLLMPTLLLGFLVGVRIVRARAVAPGSAAIVFSWLGDLALMVPGTNTFLLGLVAFFIAHVFFVFLIARHLRVRRMPFVALAYLGWWIALVALLAPHVDWLVWPLAAYGVVLGLMAALATRAPAPVVVGGLLFLVSDTILGVDRFMPTIVVWQADTMIMLTYVLAQGLIAFGVVSHLRHGASLQRGAGAVTSVAPVIKVDALH